MSSASHQPEAARRQPPAPLEPIEHFTSPVPEPSGTPSIDYQEPSTRPKSTAARLRQQGVTATPEQATADNPHVPEAVLPQVIRSEPTPGTESAGS